MAPHTCPICGKSRAHNDHRKCSKKLQRMYAPGTALAAERDKEHQARRVEVQTKVSRYHLGPLAMSGYFAAKRLEV